MTQLYEIVFILRPTLADEEVQKVLERVHAIAQKMGATIEGVHNWGKRKLAYEIKGEKKGSYVQLHVRGPSDIVGELERFFRLDDTVIKFLTVRLEALPTAPSQTPIVESVIAGPILEAEHGGV
jgi:small subunit ribosomal protein S6